MKQHYVAAFVMDHRMEQFLVIDKNNKKELFGPGIKLKLQAIGGKIKGFETPKQAILREFDEETGTTINPKLFHCFITKEYQDVKIYFFAVFLDRGPLKQIAEHAESINNGEGNILLMDTMDLFFDPSKFTFDTRAFISFIQLEVRQGFWPKLDPEGINSAPIN